MAEEHTIGLRIRKFERRFDRTGSRHTDYVELYNLSGMDEAGNIKSSTVHRVKDLEPTEVFMDREDLNEDNMIAIQARWADIGPAYEAWLKNEEIPVNGVPLAAWPGLTKTQADGLKAAGYRTVEEVAAMPESTRAKIPLPGVDAIQATAAAWLENRDQVDLVAELEEMKREMAALREAAVSAEEPEEDGEPEEEDLMSPPPKRGRPAKPAAETAAA